MAKESYGVVINRACGIDHNATEALRKSLRAPEGAGAGINRDQSPAEGMRRVAEWLAIDDTRHIVCTRCSQKFCIENENYKLFSDVTEYPLHEIRYLANTHNATNRFVFREFACPGCHTLLDVEVMLKEMPILWDVQVKSVAD